MESYDVYCYRFHVRVFIVHRPLSLSLSCFSLRACTLVCRQTTMRSCRLIDRYVSRVQRKERLVPFVYFRTRQSTAQQARYRMGIEEESEIRSRKINRVLRERESEIDSFSFCCSRCLKGSVPGEDIGRLPLLAGTVLDGDVRDEPANEQKEAGEENDGEDEILRRIVNGHLVARRELVMGHRRRVVELLVAHDDDPFGHAQTEA